MTSDPASGKTPNKNSTTEKAEGAKDVEGDPRDTRPRTPIVTGPIIELRGREVIFAIGVFFLLAIVVGLVVVLASNRIKNADDGLSMSLSNLTSGGSDGGKGGGGGGGEQEDASSVSTPVCPTLDAGRGSPDPTRAYSANCSECRRRGAYPTAWVLTAASVLRDMDPTADPCTDFWAYSCGGWLDRAEMPSSSSSTESVGVEWELERRIRKDIRAIIEGQPIRMDFGSAERKFRDLYDSCMDTRAIDALGLRPLLDIINRFGGWAFLRQ